MRRIEFNAPVEAMRGNLTGAQKLAYAENNNPAFDAPEGRQYARNYDPRYIGAKIAASGKKIFAVKTKTATKINSASLLRMALLGGSGALYAAVLKNASVLAQAEGVYAYDKSIGFTKDSFRKWLTNNLRMVIAGKMDKFIASASSSAGTFRVEIDNPWQKATGEPNCPVSDAILVKFWPQLATNPVRFKVNGMTGVAHSGTPIAQIVGSSYNVLGISLATVGENIYAKIGDNWLVDANSDYVAEDYTMTDGLVFGLTSVEPEE